MFSRRFVPRYPRDPNWSKKTSYNGLTNVSMKPTCPEGYYRWSPIDCLNLLDRYRSNWVFRVLIWQALGGSGNPYTFINPKTIFPGFYPEALKCISRKIKGTLLNYSYSDESKFKSELETISLMIKFAERDILKLKSLGVKDVPLEGLDNWVAIWKYLVRNISIDFENKTIDYYSLFRTIYEIFLIVKTDSSPNGPSLCLSKRYALLWFYLQYIFENRCSIIFETHHRHKTLTIYFIMKFASYVYDFEEFFPSPLRILFEKLGENEPQQLDLILELLRMKDLESDRRSLRISCKFPNYSELARFIVESSKKYRPDTTWKVRALAELEAYLIQHGRKVDYTK